MGEWISTKDKLPEDEAGILMVTNYGSIYSGKGVVFNKKIEPRQSGSGAFSDYYTHWMPLPELPK
jgi:hypothetical protein